MSWGGLAALDYQDAGIRGRLLKHGQVAEVEKADECMVRLQELAQTFARLGLGPGAGGDEGGTAAPQQELQRPLVEVDEQVGPFGVALVMSPEERLHRLD